MKTYRPAPLLIISGSPASLEVASIYRAHFPEGEVVDASTPAGQRRVVEIETGVTMGPGLAVTLHYQG